MSLPKMPLKALPGPARAPTEVERGPAGLRAERRQQRTRLQGARLSFVPLRAARGLGREPAGSRGGAGRCLWRRGWGAREVVTLSVFPEGRVPWSQAGLCYFYPLPPPSPRIRASRCGCACLAFPRRPRGRANCPCRPLGGADWKAGLGSGQGPMVEGPAAKLPGGPRLGFSVNEAYAQVTDAGQSRLQGKERIRLKSDPSWGFVKMLPSILH